MTLPIFSVLSRRISFTFCKGTDPCVLSGRPDCLRRRRVSFGLSCCGAIVAPFSGLSRNRGGFVPVDSQEMPSGGFGDFRLRFWEFLIAREETSEARLVREEREEPGGDVGIIRPVTRAFHSSFSPGGTLHHFLPGSSPGRGIPRGHPVGSDGRNRIPGLAGSGSSRVARVAGPCWKKPEVTLPEETGDPSPVSFRLPLRPWKS